MLLRATFLCLAALSLGAASPSFNKVGKGPGILLIHGFGGNKEVWSGVTQELARDHTVLSVDLPGSGGSAEPGCVEGRADFANLAKELVALVQKEGLSPCLVVGHSMGGPIAARTVLENPAAFRGLILVDSFLGALPAAHMEPIVVAMGKDPGTTLTKFYGPMSASPAQTERLVKDSLRIPVATLQAYLRAMTQDPLQARHRELRLPVLQMAAGPRELDPVKESGILAQYGFKELPIFRVVHFPTAKHWVMWDAPESFLLALRAFEAGLGR